MTHDSIKAYLQWDTASWIKALKFWDENVDWQQVEHCLELGGREGGLSLWLSHKGKKVVCSDYGDVEKTARPLHAKFNAENITYQNIDARDIPYENHFDVIVFKSILGGVGSNDNKPAQQQMMDQIYKALKPGGKLLFAENLKGSSLHRYLRKKFTAWGSAWRYPDLSEMKEFMKDFRQVDLHTTGVIATFGRSESQRKLLAGVDKVVLNYILPANCQYISYGIAVK